jgi:RimJ/RimL family protein N-acetyltransferase
MPKITCVLDTERFSLTRLGKEDEALYVSIHTDAKLMRSAGGAVEAAVAQAAFARLLKYAELPALKQHAWVVKEKSDLKVAPIAVAAITAHGDDVEIGIMVLAAWQGMKVAQEVIAELTEHAFEVHGARRVFTRHLAENLAGAGVMRRLGFESMPDVPDSDKYIGWVTGR